MNPVRKLTIQSLRMNRKRTVMTVIAIALSCALIVAVTGMLSSAQATIVQYTKDTVGDYHALYSDLPGDALQIITEYTETAEVHAYRHAGYAVAEGSVNEYKPYYHLLTMDEETMKASAFRLTAGRFPENASEILISGHIEHNGGIKWKIGDTMTLALGARRLDYGALLSQINDFDPNHAEEITDTRERTFTVVGIMERPSYLIENYQAPGYTIVTCDADGSLARQSAYNTFDAEVTFTSAAAARDGAEELLDILMAEGVPVSAMQTNSDLIRFSGGINEELLETFWWLLVVIISIIMVTSVFVIRNSFRISVSEKTRQYGLLATVGATRKQIRKSVLFEGFLMGVIGIPLGLLIGAAAVRVLIFLLNIIIGDDLLENANFVFSLSWVVFVAAVLLSVLTIWLSCLIPAVSASRIPPIEAIRGNREIMPGRRKLKSSRLVKKLFGIGGVVASNNLKRSRKKYRTTVVSLVVSISVFIGLSFFVEGMKNSVSVVYQDYGFNMAISAQDAKACETVAQVLELTDYAYDYYASGEISRDPWGSEYANRRYDAMRSDPDYSGWLGCEPEDNPVYIHLYNRDYFRRYLESLGVDASGDVSGIGLLFDEDIMYDYNMQGNLKKMTTERFTTAKAGDTMEVRIDIPAHAEVEEDAPLYTYEVTYYDGERKVTEELSYRSLTRRVRLVKVNTAPPYGLEGVFSDGAVLVMSEDAVPKSAGIDTIREMYVNAEDPDQLEQKIAQTNWEDYGVELEWYYNLNKYVSENRRMILIIEIFLYGFIAVITLIGVTNIFNTITTNMMLRSREFAMLKSVGMTKGQFNRMILLESALYGMKSLVFGIPLGLGLAWWIYRVLSGAIDDGFFIPWKAIGISALFVFVIVGLTMRYSLGKINKQNIIETIRSEAV
ncbi:MAG: ABC transporter permease [Lachnospiraceae bacterium]|nr:ABC transporter permease [Lachnospiraceae bacterium]